MTSTPMDPPTEGAGQPLTPEVRRGLSLLPRAYDFARDAGRDLWTLATPLHELQEVGLRNPDFRWLMSKGYVSHASDAPRAGGSDPNPRDAQEITFTESSVFVLTEAGVQFARAVGSPGPEAGPVPEADRPAPPDSREPLDLPHYDPKCRELTYRGLLVKSYQQPAPNQEAVLLAYQRQGWTRYIANPLPSDANIDAVERLGNTIRRLNSKQVNPLLRFRRDGKGTGIIWEPVPPGILKGRRSRR